MSREQNDTEDFVVLAAVANGPILHSTDLPGAKTRPAVRQRRYNHWADEFFYEGGWDVGPLCDTLTGHLSTGGEQSACTFTFEGCGLILQFWTHPWSGRAILAVDGQQRTVDLFSDTPRLHNVHFDGLAPGVHLVRMSGAMPSDRRHGGDQVVFHEAIVYDRTTEMVPHEAGQEGPGKKPGRFNAIYHAPGSLTWPERTLLYGLLFGVQAQAALLLGADQGGAALIMVAALDDRDSGTLTCIDPDPNITPEHWQKMAHRTALIVGSGKEALQAAHVRSGTEFDFVFIEETEKAMIAPETRLPAALKDEALILVRGARPESLSSQPNYIDCGRLGPVGCGEASSAADTGGLWLLRYRRSGR